MSRPTVNASLEDRILELKGALFQDKVWTALNILGIRSHLGPMPSLEVAELRVFSQNGEDGVLAALLDILPPIPTTFVEVGSGNGDSNNCRLLADTLGWSGVFIDADPECFAQLSSRYLQSDRIQCLDVYATPGNIVDTLEACGTRQELGVLSIDIDGQDFWVLQAILHNFRPVIVIAEYNARLDGPVVEVPGSVGPLTRSWGASLEAFQELGRRANYAMVYAETSGVNLFLMNNDFLEYLPDGYKVFRRRSPNYGLRGRGHHDSVLYPSGAATDRELVDPWVNER